METQHLPFKYRPGDLVWVILSGKPKLVPILEGHIRKGIIENTYSISYTLGTRNSTIVYDYKESKPITVNEELLYATPEELLDNMKLEMDLWRNI